MRQALCFIVSLLASGVVSALVPLQVVTLLVCALRVESMAVRGSVFWYGLGWGSVLRREEIWTLLADLAGAEGLNLFDVEFPVGHRGVLRLYVVPQQEGAGSVGIAECAALSKRVLALTAIEDLLPGECKLEVSSPGVNRRLRRVEHFVGAVGERIRVKYADLDQRNRVIKGVLTQFADNRLEVREEKLDELIIIPFDAISDARVDFLFK